MQPRLVARIGDGGDYHFYEDFDELAQTLAENKVKEVEHHNHYGVQADGFRGDNYISVYWAKKVTSPIAQFTDTDIQMLNDALKKVNSVQSLIKRKRLV